MAPRRGAQGWRRMRVAQVVEADALQLRRDERLLDFCRGLAYALEVGLEDVSESVVPLAP